MISFKRVNFFIIFCILFEFLLFTSSSFTSQKTFPSEERQSYFPPQRLIGVIISKDASSSIAILKNEKTGKITMLRTGESISDLVLVHVFENRIVLQTDEKIFQVFLGRSNLISADERLQKNPAKVAETDQKSDLSISDPLSNKFTKKEFNRYEIERRIQSEWSSIIKETKFVPNLIKGSISGFKITNLPKKSILSEIGIYKNDIIKEINGIKLNNMSTLVGLFNKFKDETRFEVNIERNGKSVRLLYTLK